MSVCYWLRISDWKVLIFLGSHSGDIHDRETFTERMSGLIKTIKDFDSEILEQKINEISAKDMAKVIRVADQSWILGEWGFMSDMLMYLLEKEKVEFDVVYEGDIDEEKLKDEGWHIVRNYG